MIVRVGDDRLQLIAQPDHARLARTVMEACVPLATHPRRDAILHAIAAHDDGWAEEDAAPTVNPRTGEVFDFVSAPVAVRQSTSLHGVVQLAADPWPAALVAQHRLTVYARFRSDADWSSFFAELETARLSLLRQCGGSLDDLLADYAFVRLADLISLVFCTGWTDVHQFAEWTVRPTGRRVVVEPDPFGGAIVPMEIEAREIPNRRFRSDAELRDALRHASTATLHGEVAGLA